MSAWWPCYDREAPVTRDGKVLANPIQQSPRTTSSAPAPPVSTWVPPKP